MRSMRLICCIGAACLPLCTTGAEFAYYSQTFRGPQGEVPACIPLGVGNVGSRKELSDPRRAWSRIGVSDRVLSAAPRHRTLKECADAVESYRGRYTDEHLLQLSQGKLALSMPLEFALIVLGPPDGPEMRITSLDPRTGAAVETRRYVWTNLGQIAGTTFMLGFLGAMAPAMSAGVVTSQAASIGASVAAVEVSMTSLADAKIIEIEVDARGQIISIGRQ